MVVDGADALVLAKGEDGGAAQLEVDESLDNDSDLFVSPGSINASGQDAHNAKRQRYVTDVFESFDSEKSGVSFEFFDICKHIYCFISVLQATHFLYAG